MDNGWAGLVVFLLGDPHLLEGGKGGENRTTDPDGVFTLWRSNDLDLHRRWGKSSDLLLHTVRDTWVHGGTTRLHIQVSTISVEYVTAEGGEEGRENIP